MYNKLIAGGVDIAKIALGVAIGIFLAFIIASWLGPF